MSDFFSTLTLSSSSFGGIFVLFYCTGMYFGKNMLRILGKESICFLVLVDNATLLPVLILLQEFLSFGI
ncbi:MAG TPA: hypothetical protein VLD84_06745 [Nitrososphaeraceae archaeon]|nr:hypothetical protein [Nitrososphaeraceae archaeon]